MKKSSRNWSIEQDKMLSQVMQPTSSSRKLKWQQVAQIMHQKIQTCQKTGKQCRERWHNHLAPELNNSGEWTKQQNQILFKYHCQLGNKWAKIATYLKGRTDNCVKNHFYSTLRRGMRKVNNFIHQYRKKKNSIKQFKPDVLTKILIVADGDPQQKLNAKNNADDLSKKIKELLIQVSLEENQEAYDQNVLDKVIQLIMQFNKNCKKRKGKKKGPPTDKLLNVGKEQENQQEISQLISQTDKDISVSIIKQQTVQKSIVKNTRQSKQKIKQKYKYKQKQKQKLPFNPKAIRKQQKKQQQQQKQKQITKTAIVSNQSGQTKQNNNQNDDQQQKDQVKSVQFQAPPPAINQNNNTLFGKRAGSMQSFHSQLNPHNNFGGTSFYNPANYNNQDMAGVERIFHGSGFELPQDYQQNHNYKEMFADSNAEGIKKGEAAFFRLSGRSLIDEKGSFFAILGDKGTIEPSDLIQSGTLDPRTSAIQGLKFKKDNQSPGTPFLNASSAFSKPELCKNFLLSGEIKDLPKLNKQDSFSCR